MKTLVKLFIKQELKKKNKKNLTGFKINFHKLQK